MRDTCSVLKRWLPAIALSLGMALGAGCMSGAAETPDNSAATAARLSGQTAKFHVVLGDGPFKGTYDVAAEVCLAGVMKAGSWHATWEAETAPKDKLTAVIVGFDPKPTFGNGITMMVNFGDEEDKILYEIQKPAFTVADRGQTATLTFKGKARVAFYKDGTFADGGQAEITVECGKVQRG